MEGIGKTLLAAGHKTNYHEAGKGDALFLLHGSGPGVSGWSNWSKSMASFSDKWRVIVPDIAGFGFTEFHEGTKYDIKLWVSHLVGIMDALDIQKASFVGNSFGGALAIGVCDQLNMLQYSTYSVISPEGCASILWKTAEKAPEAAEAMGITAERLKGLGIVDKVIDEPLGGAHRDPASMAESIRGELLAQLKMLQGLEMGELLERRYDRLMSYGAP